MSAAGATGLPVLICGGGIGGLSAALALTRRGIGVQVFEAEAEFSESGAGIQIGPNGSHILHSWGLGETLQTVAARPRAIHIGDGQSGRRLASIPLGRIADERYGAPYYVAERRVLHKLLLSAVKAATEVIPSFRFDTLESGPDRIVAVAQDGRRVTGQALIGADGVHSRVRSRLFGASPSFSGRNAWRATAPIAKMAVPDNDVHLWMGTRAHLVHYCCGPDGPLNAVAVTTGDAASPGWGMAADADRLLGMFSDWSAAPRQVLQRFSDWMVWPLLALEPLGSWTAGRATLLGDAAHPIMPFLASGAVMAIEDAEALAVELTRSADDPEAGFRRYERRRSSRTARVRDASQRMGEIYHMSGPMRTARNMALSVLPASRLLSRNDWLYSYRIRTDSDSGANP